MVVGVKITALTVRFVEMGGDTWVLRCRRVTTEPKETSARVSSYPMS